MLILGKLGILPNFLHSVTSPAIVLIEGENTKLLIKKSLIANTLLTFPNHYYAQE